MTYTTKHSSKNKGNIVELKVAVGKTRANSTRVKLLNKLAESLYRSAPEEALSHATEALQVAYQIKYEQGIGESSNLIGKIHWNQGNFEKAEAAFIEALAVRERIKDTTGTAQSYNALGAIYPVSYTHLTLPTTPYV